MKYYIVQLLTVFSALGLYGQTALHFDGENDYVNLDPIASSMDTLNEFTLDFWVKFDLADNLDYGVFFGVNSANNGNVFLIRVSNGNFDPVNDGAIVYINDNGNQYMSGNTPIGDGECHHIAFTYNNSVCKLFVDGNLETTANHTITFNATDRFSLGQEYDAGSNPISNLFEGELNEVRIWNEEKDALEIEDLMTFVPNSNTPQLLHHFKLDDGLANGNNSGLTTCSNSSNPTLNGTLNNFSLSGYQSNYISSTCFNNVYTFELDTQLCFGPYESPFGDMYQESGSYIDTISNGGNDTIFQLTLELLGEQMNTDIYLGNLDSIWSVDSVSSYQWLNCEEEFAAIPGATNQSFLPVNNGYYAVELTLNGCVDTSDCILVKGLDINTYSQQVVLYPNPTTDHVYIQGLIKDQSYTIRIFSQLGKLLDENHILGQENRIDIPDLKGYYLIQAIHSSTGEVLQWPVVKH